MRASNNNQPSAASPENVVTRIVFIPELLHIIFGFLSKKHNVSNACVCKLWSEIALDTIWREMCNLVHLFKALKPMQLNRVGCYEFVAPPDVTDWTAFQKYARRVRFLSFDKNTPRANILDDVARTRISLDILPNLHTLRWIDNSTHDLKHLLLFLHGGIKHLTVPCLQDRGKLLSDICARSPNLHTLFLYIPRSVDITSHARVIAQNLDHLRKLVLPEFYYTSAVIQELSHMKNLSIIEFEYCMSVGTGHSMNIDSFNPVLTEGSFPALCDLSLTAGIDDVERFFRDKFAPVNVTDLYLNSYKKHTPSEVHSLLLALSQVCQRLTRLHIVLLEKEFNLSELPSDEQISFDTLQPVFSFSHLTWFEILHKYPLKITLNDVEELSSRLPLLESLGLNPEPLYTRKCTLDLRALLPFAKHCHKLKVLGIFINATGIETPPAHSLIKPFHALQTLDVGTSRLENPCSVSAFLSLLLPPWCTLQNGITWQYCGTEEHRQLDPNVAAEILDQMNRWADISVLLPSLVEARRDDRQRTNALREEVEELRIQNRLLMDKTGIRANDSCTIA